MHLILLEQRMEYIFFLFVFLYQLYKIIIFKSGDKCVR